MQNSMTICQVFGHADRHTDKFSLLNNYQQNVISVFLIVYSEQSTAQNNDCYTIMLEHL